MIHLSQMIEKCRATMQSQFDQWYSNLQARNGVLGGPTSSSTHGSAYADQAPTNTSMSMLSSSSSTAAGLNMSMQSLESSDYGTSSSGGRRVPSLQFDAKADKPDSKSTEPSGAYSQSNQRQQQYSHQSGGSVGSRTPLSAAPSYLAESKDEEVNEDIKLFYQAKEEMLRRRGGGN